MRRTRSQLHGEPDRETSRCAVASVLSNANASPESSEELTESVRRRATFWAARPREFLKASRNMQSEVIMSDEDLRHEVRQLRDELEKEKSHRRDEDSGNILGGIIWLGCVIGVGYWLFNGGFGEAGRFLFWMGLFQR